MLVKHPNTIFLPGVPDVVYHAESLPKARSMEEQVNGKSHSPLEAKDKVPKNCW
jgi:hypothetical protein